MQPFTVQMSMITIHGNVFCEGKIGLKDTETQVLPLFLGVSFLCSLVLCLLCLRLPLQGKPMLIAETPVDMVTITTAKFSRGEHHYAVI